MTRRIREGIAWLLGYRQVPYSCRLIFRYEFFHMLVWGLVWGGLNGNFAGYVASRALHASDLLVAVIAASMAVANCFAVMWSSLLLRCSKKGFLHMTMLGTAVVLASVFATPMAGAWFAGLTGEATGTAVVFTLQILLCWLLMQASNTARTQIWRLNYPASHRGRILARFAIGQVLCGAAWGALMGAYCDGAFHVGLFGRRWLEADISWLPLAGTPEAYRVIYPFTGAMALLCVWTYRRVVVRREPARPVPPGGNGLWAPNAEGSYVTPGWFSTLAEGLRAGIREGWSVLRDDRAFRQYMIWQFLAGAATMMIAVPMILILKDVFGSGYLQVASLLIVIPQVVMVITTGPWAHWFDRLPLYRFRAVHMGLWTVSRLLLAAGVGLRSLEVVAAALALAGASLAAGRFSWQLGHMAFSRRFNDATYMGVHQTLTGVRGLTMPFVGLLLYRTVLGWHVIWLSAVLQGITAWGFWRLARTDPALRSRATDGAMMAGTRR